MSIFTFTFTIPGQLSEKEIKQKAKRLRKVQQFNRILDRIQFENKHKYKLVARIHSMSQDYFVLEVQRTLICSATKVPRNVTNDQHMKYKIGVKEFIKHAFKAIGQFESHEFVESFKVFGVNAYFPHEDERVKFWFEGGDHVNRHLLNPYEAIASGHSDWLMATWYFKRAFTATALAKQIDAFAKAHKNKVTKKYWIDTFNKMKVRSYELYNKVLFNYIDSFFKSANAELPAASIQPSNDTFSYSLKRSSE